MKVYNCFFLNLEVFNRLHTYYSYEDFHFHLLYAIENFKSINFSTRLSNVFLVFQLIYQQIGN